MLPLKLITSLGPIVKRRRTFASRTIPMVLFAGALSGGVMLATGALSANDWPEWRGPARDGQSTESHVAGLEQQVVELRERLQALEQRQAVEPPLAEPAAPVPPAEEV